MSVALRSLSTAAALLLCQIEAAPALSLDMIRAACALHLCAHPNSLPYANKAGNPPGFQIELGQSACEGTRCHSCDGMDSRSLAGLPGRIAISFSTRSPIPGRR